MPGKFRFPEAPLIWQADGKLKIFSLFFILGVSKFKLFEHLNIEEMVSNYLIDITRAYQRFN